MSDQQMMERCSRLFEFLKTKGIATPVVGAGKNRIFVYALLRDRPKMSRFVLTEYEGVSVEVSFGGPFKALVA